MTIRELAIISIRDIEKQFLHHVVIYLDGFKKNNNNYLIILYYCYIEKGIVLVL
jgi:hypothetical protein